MFNGERVRRLRKERNYTLEELASRGGISVSFLSELERGGKMPSLGTVEKLAVALNVSPEELIEQNGDIVAGPGKQIRAYRREKGLGLEELATAAGLSYSYLCGIERGLVMPSPQSLKRIAAALGMPLQALLSPYTPTLGQKLTGIRREQGLNRSQLARRASLSPGLIGRIEKDQIQPSLQTLEKIAAALKISPCYFIAEEDSVEGLLRLLDPAVRELLLDRKVHTVLRALRRCNEKECRLVLDFVGLLKEANLCDPGAD
ncbi:MAG: helix-turn-helix domain-containing protein [Dethiobacteria bacterium]|jgi:transcriptional regulator with XRE-family HTH domain